MKASTRLAWALGLILAGAILSDIGATATGRVVGIAGAWVLIHLMFFAEAETPSTPDNQDDSTP